MALTDTTSLLSGGSRDGWLMERWPRDQGFTGRLEERKSMTSDRPPRPNAFRAALAPAQSSFSFSAEESVWRYGGAAALDGPINTPARTNARYSRAHSAAVSMISRFSRALIVAVSSCHQFGLSSSTVRQYSVIASDAGIFSSAFQASHFSCASVSKNDQGRGFAHGPFVACSCNACSRSAVSSSTRRTPTSGGSSTNAATM